jgi:protein-L-isoaspartate(D-aspartate) O-methyltransferase
VAAKSDARRPVSERLYEQQAEYMNRRVLAQMARRTEEEKANLLYWQFTCEMFCTPKEWEWWFAHTGYTGDHSFIYFE